MRPVIKGALVAAGSARISFVVAAAVELSLCLYIFSAAAGAHSTRWSDQSARPVDNSAIDGVIVQSFKDGLAGVRAANPGVHLSVGRDSSMADEPVLIVEYPERTSDPAGRDIQCAAETQDWTSGRAIAFQARPDHPMRLSVSFLDRNHVAYTAWTDLKGGEWQLVRIPFDEIRPNPFFQPPDARKGAPIDVSDVKFIAFAPQDQSAGRLVIGRFVVSK